MTVLIWRWALSGFGLIASIISFKSLPCINNQQNLICLNWLEPSKSLHKEMKMFFQFLFGGQWTEPVAAFIGYIALVIYIVGIIQWLLIKLPKQGRIAGDF